MYTFKLCANLRDERGGGLPNVYNYLISCVVDFEQNPFPKQEEWNESCYLIEPLQGHLSPKSTDSNDILYFKVKVSNANLVEVVIGDDWIALAQKSDSDVWDGNVPMTPYWGKETFLMLCAKYSSHSSDEYSVLLEYQLNAS